MKIIISFRAFLNLNSNFEDYNFPNIKNINNSIIKQPELGIFPINENNPLFLNNMLLSGKLIKSGVYRAAVNILGNLILQITWVSPSSFIDDQSFIAMYIHSKSCFMLIGYLPRQKEKIIIMNKTKAHILIWEKLF